MRKEVHKEINYRNKKKNNFCKGCKNIFRRKSKNSKTNKSPKKNNLKDYKNSNKKQKTKWPKSKPTLINKRKKDWTKNLLLVTCWCQWLTITILRLRYCLKSTGTGRQRRSSSKRSPWWWRTSTYHQSIFHQNWFHKLTRFMEKETLWAWMISSIYWSSIVTRVKN